MKLTAKIFVLLISIFNATILVAQDSVAPGPCLEKRKQIHDYLAKAKKAGVGTTPYEKALVQIESDVQAGKSEEEIKKSLSSLTASLTQQVNNFKALKAAPPVYRAVRPTGSSASSTPSASGHGDGHDDVKPPMGDLPSGAARRTSTDEMEAYMVTLLNKHRREAGLGSFSPDSVLTSAARGHARDMIKRKFFDHINPSGEDPRARAKAAGFAGWVRENIAYTDQMGAGLVMVETADKALMNSPGHKKNIMDPGGTIVGIGIVYDSKGGISVCQLFSP